MNCRRTRKAFGDFIDGTLDDQRLDRLLDHLDRCPECAGLLEVMQSNLALLRGVSEAPLPDRLHQRLCRIPLTDFGEAPMPEPGIGGWLFSNAMAAALLAAIVTVNLTWLNPGFSESLQGLRQSFADESARVMDAAAGWETEWADFKSRMLDKLDHVGARDSDANGVSDETEAMGTGDVLTEIRRIFDLKGT